MSQMLHHFTGLKTLMKTAVFCLTKKCNVFLAHTRPSLTGRANTELGLPYISSIHNIRRHIPQAWCYPVRIFAGCNDAKREKHIGELSP